MTEKTKRLDKFLTEMTDLTRTQAKEAARKGRITVNGTVVRKTDGKISPETDTVTLDGREIRYTRFEYYMLNKPQGVVSATEDGRYPTAVELITGRQRKDLFPAGRLDLDTEGLLLITNDGDLAHRLLSPKKHVDKVYYLHFQGMLPSDAEQTFQDGIILEDGTKARPADLTILSSDKNGGKARLTIREGKYHQVKRMLEACGCRVTYLKRLSMGSLSLDEQLKPGEYRPLTELEIKQLKGES